MLVKIRRIKRIKNNLLQKVSQPKRVKSHLNLHKVEFMKHQRKLYKERCNFLSYENFLVIPHNQILKPNKLILL
jgi:hypothetical protein